MNVRYEQFIGMYDNVYPDYFCQHIINEFERLNQTGIVRNRQETESARKHIKQDEFLFLNLRNQALSEFQDENTLDIFWQGLQNCFDHYVNEYDVLKNINIRCSSIKVQKTEPGGGYHIWHHEQGNDSQANRSLVYSIYLNTIQEAGETEFLYQKLRIPCKENTCIIWPAAHTHAHRGNVVHGTTPKYIITGWFYNE